MNDITLGVGYTYAGIRINNLTLAESDGICEKVYLDKLAEKPYTWMGRVLSISIAQIEGQFNIAAEARQEYLKAYSPMVHPAIKQMALADVTTLLFVIHREMWQNLFTKQECLCKYCSHKFYMDIDLNKLDYSDEDKATIEKMEGLEEYLVCNLSKPFVIQDKFSSSEKNIKDMLSSYVGKSYDQFIFKIPTLDDAIRNEKYQNDETVFWRRIAFDCLVNVKNSATNEILDKDIIRMLGMKLYESYLSVQALRSIRTTLREELPVITPYYEEECPKCKRLTPVSIEASNFFKS